MTTALITILTRFTCWLWSGVNALVESDRGSLVALGGAVRMPVARLDNIPTGRDFIVQGEVAGASGLQQDLCFPPNLQEHVGHKITKQLQCQLIINNLFQTCKAAFQLISL